MITCKITTRPRADGGLFFSAGWRVEALCRPSGQEVSGAGRNPGTGGWNPKGAAQGASPLSRASGAAIKKVPGQCANTPPAGTARERTLLSYTVVLLSMFRPRRMPPDGGLCFVLHSGRSPEYQTKERQQRQDDKASHAAWPPLPV